MASENLSPSQTVQTKANDLRKTPPTIYERNINVKVIDSGGPQFRVTASLFDLEHNFHVDLVVDISSGQIVEASAVMAKRPYPTYCLCALDNVAKLKGETIGRGINRRVTELLGRSTGCFHLVEVFLAAIGFTATILIGKRSQVREEAGLSEEESRAKWFPVLKNTCQVFREDTPQKTQA